MTDARHSHSAFTYEPPGYGQSGHRRAPAPAGRRAAQSPARPAPSGRRVPQGPAQAPPQGSRRGAASGQSAKGAGKLTALAAVLLSLGSALVGALINVAVTNDFGWLFAVIFIGGTIAVALTIRHADMMTAVIMPPISFLAAIVVGIFMETNKLVGHSLTARAASMGTALGDNAGELFIGTALALVIVVARMVQKRRQR